MTQTATWTPNRANIDRAIEVLEGVRDECFDLRTFTAGDETKLPLAAAGHLCDTTACVVGYFPEMWPKLFAWVRGNVVNSTGREIDSYEAACERFEVNLDTASAIVYPDQYPPHRRTRTDVIRRLRLIRDHGPAWVDHCDEEERMYL